MKRSAIILSIAVTIVAAGHAPNAWACSCVGGLSRADHAEMADHVFIGDVTDIEAPAHEPGEPMSSGDQMTVFFALDRIIKGDPTDEPVVGTPQGGASCGYAFKVGYRYRVYATGEGASLQTNLCMGNEELGEAPDGPTEPQPLPPEQPGTVEATPDARSSDQARPSDGGPLPTADPQPVALGGPGDDAGGTNRTLPIAVGLAALIAGAGGLMAARFRRS